MLGSRRKEILSWMLANSRNGTWWRPGALTKEGNPDGKPPANLNAAEDLCVFEDLKKKELLVSAINDKMQPCFVLNECKEEEWKDEIEDAERPWWKKSKIFKKTGKVIIWIIATFLVGYLAALAEKFVNSSSIEMQPSVSPPAQQSGSAPQQPK